MNSLKALLLAPAFIAAAPLAHAQLSANAQGHYSLQSAMRIHGTKEFCDSENGEFDERGDGLGFCYIYSPSGNSITVEQTTVQVQTIYGSGRMRSFEGRITKVLPSGEIIAREAEEDGSLIKNGCVMSISVNENGYASASPGRNCDEGLTINGAKKNR